MSMLNKEIVSAELFSAGWCNLNCKYCYIPKDENLTRSVHEKIIKSIENGELLNRLVEAFGENLVSLSHWGTEPSLTLPIFTKSKWYEKAVTRFPNLREVKLSSNFMTNPNNLIEFIETFPSDKVLLDIQMSLDGPEETTDRNRGIGSTKKILINGLEFFDRISQLPIKNRVRFHFKPTMSMQDVVLFSDIVKLREYYKFFDDYIGQLKSLDKNSKIEMSVHIDPSLVVPGFYTKESGVYFSKVVENQYILNTENFKHIAKPKPNQHLAFLDKFIGGNQVDYYTKHSKFQCSSGSTQVAMQWDETAHLCHRSFYLGEEDWDGFKKAMSKHVSESINSDDYSNGRYDLFRNIYTANYSDNKKLTRLQYLGRSFHDFWAQKLAFNTATIYEMALSGQVSECYKNKEMAELFAKFLTIAECPLENILNNGSILLHCLGNFRVFGNGAFEQILGKVMDEQARV